HLQRCHAPRRRSIQYSAAEEIEQRRHGVLDRPPSRTMTAGAVSIGPRLWKRHLERKPGLLRPAPNPPFRICASATRLRLHAVSCRLEPIRLDEELCRHLPFGVQPMNHLDGKGTLSVQYFRCSRAGTEQFRELRLRVPALLDQVVQNVDRIDSGKVDRPM